MSALFKKPKMPQIEMPEPPPPPPDPYAQEQARLDIERAKFRDRKSRGRAATILTGGDGLRDEAPVTARILGGG